MPRTANGLPARPMGITAGPDGNLWFTEEGGDQIGRITPSGGITVYAVPGSAQPYMITAGPDGNLWFTEQGANEIVSVTTSGVFTQYPLPAGSGSPYGITAGPDGNLWFTELNGAEIGEISPSGTIAEYAIPTGASVPPELITAGPDNTVWFTATDDANNNYIGETTISSPSAPTNLTAPTPTSQSPVLSWTGVAGATAYNIYRNGAVIGTSTSTTYTDSAVPYGTYSYYVTAVNGTGESTPSNTISVTYAVPTNYTVVNFTDSNGNPLSNAKVVAQSSTGTTISTTTDSFGNAYLNTTPGTYKVTVYYANGYQSQTITTTPTGPNTVSFSTVPVTVTINDPNPADIAAATVAQAGNTGTFGSKQAVNSNGQITFQVLPGANYFTAYVANGYQEQSITASATTSSVTFNTDSVQVTVTKNGTPLTTALVDQAGNSGSFGAKQAVDGNGQVTFYVLPGTNTFIAWDGTSYTKQTLNVTGDSSVSIAVQ